MLVHPFPPSHPTDHRHDHHHDPFQALYDSLANLTLTTTGISIGNNHSSAARGIPSTAQPPSTSTDHPSQPGSDTITITPLFPPGDNVIFAHSSFFRRPAWPGNIYPDLPTPAQVRAEAAGDDNADSKYIAFPSHGLLIKYGRSVSAAEGKAMSLVRRALLAAAGAAAGTAAAAGDVPVPVPEVFGWRRDAETGERLLYMDLPEGDVLEERWAGLSEVEREAVCGQLRELVGEWRRLRLGGVGFVGSVDNGPLQDEVFCGSTAAGAPPPGPFPTAAAFHDYFVAMSVTMSQSRHANAGGDQVRYIPQHLFPSDVAVVFTHGALHPRNIIVSAGPKPRVVAIIGWEQAGWYPAYWELCKARSECSRRGRLGGWESKYLPWILDAEGLNSELREWNVGALCQYWDYFVGLM